MQKLRKIITFALPIQVDYENQISVCHGSCRGFVFVRGGTGDG